MQAFLCSAWTFAKAAIERAQEQQQQYQAKRVKTHSFKPGDLVLLYNPLIPPTVSKKLWSFWKPDFKVIRVIEDTNAEIVPVSRPDIVPYRVAINRLQPQRMAETSPKTEFVSKPKEDTPSQKSASGQVSPTHHYNLRPRR